MKTMQRIRQKVIDEDYYLIALFAKNSQIHNQITNAEEVFVPCIAIGELFYGRRSKLSNCSKCSSKANALRSLKI